MTQYVCCIGIYNAASERKTYKHHHASSAREEPQGLVVQGIAPIGMPSRQRVNWGQIAVRAYASTSAAGIVGVFGRQLIRRHPGMRQRRRVGYTVPGDSRARDKPWSDASGVVWAHVDRGERVGPLVHVGRRAFAVCVWGVARGPGPHRRREVEQGRG